MHKPVKFKIGIKYLLIFLIIMINCILITPENEISLINANSDIELENKIMDYVTPYYGEKITNIGDNIIILTSNLIEDNRINYLATRLIDRKVNLRGNAILICRNKWNGRLYNIQEEIINKLEYIRDITIS